MAIKVYVYKEPCNMGKSYKGLTSLIEDEMRGKPESGSLFVFFNKRADYVKVFWRDIQGSVILAKKLAEDVFEIPGVKQITLKNLEKILGGMGLRDLILQYEKRKLKKAA